MSLPTNTYSSYDAKGNREDLENIIYDISPTDTPFLSNAGRVKAKGVFHEWQTDVLDTAAANKQLEGDDATGNTLASTTRYGNYCQIARKVVVVSGTQEAIDKAGRDSELKYQIAKAGKALKRDMEYALTQNQAIENGSEATARALGSVESWLFSATGNVVDGTGGTTPAYSSGALAGPTDASTTNRITFTEARLKSVIQSCWTDGGDPRMVMVGPFNKTKASAFQGIATLYKDVPGKKQATVIGAADVYVSDFGEHMIVPNRFSRDRTALVLDMDYWKVATLRPIQQIPLAKTGDSEKREMLVEFTLVAANPNSSGKVADLTTS
jgi:hypothetical protein